MDWVKVKMQQARLQRDQVQKQEHIDAADQQQNNSRVLSTNRPAHSYGFSQKLVWLATGLTSGAITVSLVWWSMLIDLGAGTENDHSKSKISEQVQERPERNAVQPEPDRKFIQPGDAELASTEPEPEMLPPPAAGTTELSAVTDVNTNLSITKNHIDVKATAIHAAIGAKPQEPKDNKLSGKWAINLVSLKKRVDAEQFAANAHSKGVAAEIDQVMVGGKIYWRVQLPGFSSVDEARTKVDEVQEKLGLKNIWIVKRQ